MAKKNKPWKPSKRFKENLRRMCSEGKVSIVAQPNENKMTIQTPRFTFVIQCKELEVVGI